MEKLSLLQIFILYQNFLSILLLLLFFFGGGGVGICGWGGGGMDVVQFHLCKIPALLIIKCSEKCARRDWSEGVHHTRVFIHTSALLRYNARSLRHHRECEQFTIRFIKEIKNLFLVNC